MLSRPPLSYDQRGLWSYERGGRYCGPGAHWTTPFVWPATSQVIRKGWSVPFGHREASEASGALITITLNLFRVALRIQISLVQFKWELGNDRKQIPTRRHVLTTVLNVNEMVPHVPTTATCLNALSVPMLRQVSAGFWKYCEFIMYRHLEGPQSVFG